MNEVKLIGLSGQLQNGKDTVADLILKLTTHEFGGYLGTKWKTKRFAGNLKIMTSLIIGCDVADLEHEDFKNRELGEEWRVYPAFYVDANDHYTKLFASREEREHWIENDISDSLCARRKDSYCLTPRLILQLLGTEGGRDVIHPNIWVNSTLGGLKDTDYVIVTDTRFPNEVEGIKKKGGIVIRVIRPDKKSTSTHPSETSLNDYNNWDYVIINDGTLEDLETKVKKMLNHFKLK